MDHLNQNPLEPNQFPLPENDQAQDNPLKHHFDGGFYVGERIGKCHEISFFLQSIFNISLAQKMSVDKQRKRKKSVRFFA